jgi:cytoskeletal protein CcmA (bactofilin family)
MELSIIAIVTATVTFIVVVTSTVVYAKKTINMQNDYNSKMANMQKNIQTISSEDDRYNLKQDISINSNVTDLNNLQQRYRKSFTTDELNTNTIILNANSGLTSQNNNTRLYAPVQGESKVSLGFAAANGSYIDAISVGANYNSAFKGGIAVSEDSTFNKGVNISGSSVFGETSTKALNVTGESTFRDNVLINKNENIKGNMNVNGIINAEGGINISNKWKFADTGDNFIKLTGVNTNDYNGGLAAANLYIKENSSLNGNTTVNGPLNVNGDITATNEIYTSGWLRPKGNAGLYFQDHGGGWNMTDDTWIRSHNNKNVYSSQEIRANRMSTEGPLFVGDNSQGGWTGANFKRKDGQWTHFDWKDDGKNYIRGSTTINGQLDVTGTLNVNDGQDDNTNRGISLWHPNDKRFGIWMGQHSANGGKSLTGGPVPSGDIAHHSVRFSTGANPDGAHGFVFQNSDGKALMSIKGNDARTNIYGDLNAKGINNLTKDGYAVNNGKMYPGSLTIGGTNDNYGHGNNWNASTAGLLMECADKTEIAVNDSGTRVASIAAYDGPNNRVEIGRDMAWGPLDLVDINANKKLALKQEGGNTLNFTSSWQGTPDNVRNVSEISNDTLSNKQLMIVGNKSAGGNRQVGIWDTLNMNGHLNMKNGGMINFPNDGSGLNWGNGYSKIYDNGNLNILTDDTMIINAPTNLELNTPQTNVNGFLTVKNNTQINGTLKVCDNSGNNCRII